MVEELGTGLDSKLVDDELEIIQVGDNWGGMIHFSGIDSDRTKTVHGSYMAGTDESKVVFWGKNNSLPDERELLISNNNIVPQLLATKRNIILGSGLMAYKRVINEDGSSKNQEVEMPRQWRSFLDKHDIEDEYLPSVVNSTIFHASSFTEFGKDKTEKDWAVFKARACRVVRAEVQNKSGEIPYYHIWNNWSKVNSQQRLEEASKKVQRIEAYKKGKDQNKFLLQASDKMLGGPYYFTPTWEGAWNWIKLANCIPEFHLAQLRNGFNIRFIIKVPEDYFLRSLSTEKRQNNEQAKKFIQEAKSNFKKRINSFLAGHENAGRGLIITTHIYKHLQKEMPGVEIIPLEIDLKDDAMLKLFDSSNAAITSATGTPVALAAVATNSKMGSGSEVRSLYNFYQLSQAPYYRRIALRAIRVALKLYDVDKSIQLGFRNIEMTTTDKNPTGKQESNSFTESTEQ